MKIYFVEVESSERQFFESELADQELHFVSNLQEVDCHTLYDARPPRAGELR